MNQRTIGYPSTSWASCSLVGKEAKGQDVKVTWHCIWKGFRPIKGKDRRTGLRCSSSSSSSIYLHDNEQKYYNLRHNDYITRTSPHGKKTYNLRTLQFQLMIMNK